MSKKSEANKADAIDKGTADALLLDEDVATRLRVSTSTLAKWRMQRIGPSFLRIGGRVAYEPAEIDRYIAASRVTTIAAEA